MQKSKKDYSIYLVLFILLSAILVSSCTTCKSSQYRRRYYSEVQKLDLNNKINNI
jgi:hypothetical protein